MGSLSLCPKSFQESFEPMLDGAIVAPFGDLLAVEKLIDAQTAAIIIEPIQGEGGIIVPSIEFMQGLRKLCDKHSILMICDEVWTAPGRTGSFFAYQHFGITPDIVTIAKALGAGLPLAAVVVAEKWVNVLSPGTHGCTLGGNPLCAAAAVAALEVVDKENLVLRAKELGEKCQDFFRQLRSPKIIEVRGKGLMWGIKLAEDIGAKPIMSECIERGVFIAAAKQNVVRFAPAMNISEALLFEGFDVVTEVLNSDKH
ncbi:UNVERIFIED_CONTAM: hypothetical protein GTU68_026168 [Idotea baltica]|nr:hypothetical protein [Idotea baltica]